MSNQMSREEQEELEAIANGGCQTCDGPLVLLGTLGNRTHFRCRDCGVSHSFTREDS